jgi:gustatory receptor
MQEGSSKLVCQYRALWISLSRLSRETGLFMCYTYGHMCVLSFSVLTLSLYGSLSNVHDGLYMRHLGLGMAVCVIGGITYVISNVAHHTASEVSLSADNIWGS